MARPLPLHDPRPQATYEDARWFMETLRDEFAAADPEKFEAILNVLRAFKAERIDTAGAVARMEDLLSGHRELLHDFNQFLPWCYIRAHGPAGGNIH
ncbi:unnamed protein product [Urochloa decumbens]|uniref:Uncharacterized protein n=1 Tax=Urochloa decumbens TaxID=240449 RepID=A0ABC9BP49_9POAL